MRLPLIKCECDEIIVKAQDDVSKVRSKVLIIKGNSVLAVCKSCNNEVIIPLQVIPDRANPPVFITNIKKSS